MESLTEKEFNKLDAEEKLVTIYKEQLESIFLAVKRNRFLIKAQMGVIIFIIPAAIFNFFTKQYIWFAILIGCIKLNLYTRDKLLEIKKKIMLSCKQLVLDFENKYKYLINSEIKNLHRKVKERL